MAYGADGVEMNPGVGGDTAATDLVGGQHYQAVKVAVGGDGEAEQSATVYRKVAAGDGTDDLNVKAAAAVVYGVVAVNTSETQVAYLHLYDKQTAPVLGTDTPHMTIPLPKGGGVSFPIPSGAKFGTGLGFGIGSSVSGSGYVTANSVVMTLLYV